MNDELSVQCIICLQHFEPCCEARCMCVESRHFVCNADLDAWVLSDHGLLIPCPLCNTYTAPLARPTPVDVFDTEWELEGLRLKLEGLRLY
jgi:hypothetical protein